jgi:hypothetical protein
LHEIDIENMVGSGKPTKEAVQTFRHTYTAAVDSLKDDLIIIAAGPQNREAVFEAATKAGRTTTEAAYESKDLMDFSLRGGWAGYQILADVLPFFNARVQGLYRLGRSDPKRLAAVGGILMVASLLLARLSGLPLADCVGAGTGLDAAGIERKRAVLQQALDANASATSPLDALAALGGYEVATLVGAVLQAAAERRVIVVDGFITSAAVLVASRLAPAVLQRCVFSHRSGERGHGLMLAQMQAEPLLDLGLRLGEGSGAALAWPLLQSACALLREMASFESAGVATQG